MHLRPYFGPALCVLLCVLLAITARAAGKKEPLVYNGAFEQLTIEGSRPKGWTTAGRSDIQQNLAAVQDPERGRVAKLTCTHFEGGTPDAHVMIAQTDKVAVERGNWYRFSLWARAKNLKAHAVDVGLSNTRTWSRTGLAETFAPSLRWQRFEFLFQATQNVDPADSRLQIWFKSTGTLWLDDIKLIRLEKFSRTWHPSVSLDERQNAVFNSGFECGGEEWGCWAPGIPGWGAHVFNLMGQWDDEEPYEGTHCWKITLDAENLPVTYFDYYEPVEEPLKALLIGHERWVKLTPGESYVFSAYVRADRPELPVRISIWETPGRRHGRTFSVDTEWKRVEFNFEPQKAFACGFVGPDLREKSPPDGTFWLDAVQFERGRKASEYRPGKIIESCIETPKSGNVFANASDGLSCTLRAFNHGNEKGILRGKLTLHDFRDRSVWEKRVRAEIPPHSHKALEYANVSAGRQGFYRLRWEPVNGTAQELRCAVIEPYKRQDSVFGMNHAYSWDFLLNLAHQAGVRWWRDWSVKWDTVQPQPDGFDFSVPDAQINRVLEAGGNVLVLLPFPSSTWASEADMQKAEEEAAGNRYLKHRLQVAWKPENVEHWADYVRATVNHYKDRVGTYEILNEPLFTTYSVPARFGYSMPDYLDLLRTAREAARDADADCRIIGGTSCPPTVHWLTKFVKQEGLQWCDVTKYHMYPSAAWPESHESALHEARKLMQQEEGTSIWFTEFGLYADDDPPCMPYAAGDATMNRAMRPNELQAAADMVRFAAIFCAYGVRKIFYHAGTCAEFHRSSAGNVFFEYGGEPRKQYAAQAALSHLLGPDFRFVRKWENPESVTAYEFHSGGRKVVILWTRERNVIDFRIPRGLQALDLMGNPLDGPILELDDIPIYLVSQ